MRVKSDLEHKLETRLERRHPSYLSAADVRGRCDQQIQTWEARANGGKETDWQQLETSVSGSWCKLLIPKSMRHARCVGAEDGRRTISLSSWSNGCVAADDFRRHPARSGSKEVAGHIDVVITRMARFERIRVGRGSQRRKNVGKGLWVIGLVLSPCSCQICQ